MWLIFTGFRKVVGLFWYWLVFPFRRYARSVVQNYALQAKSVRPLERRIHLERLMQRMPRWSPPSERYGWALQDIHNVGNNGFVAYRKVSTVEFWLVVFLIWGWLDDDSNQDTYDVGHCKRYTEGDLQNSIMGRLFRKQLLKAIEDGVYGNTFDLGDLRAETPNFNFIAVLIWNTRNTAYNFYYLFKE